MILHHLSWFLGAFGATLGVLALLRYRLGVYERRLELKNTLQEISQEVALGYFQNSYNRLCEIQPASECRSEITVLKAQCLLGLGRRPELLDFLAHSLENYPKNHAARRMYAKLLVESSQSKLALGQYELLKGKLLEEDLLPHALALYQTGQWSKCQSLIEEKCKQPSGPILCLLADALFQQQNWLHALDYYKKAENLLWRPLSLIAGKSECLMQLDRLEEAEHTLREWLRAQPRNFRAGLLLASSLERQGKVQDALQILEAFEEDFADDSLAHATLGRCYFKLKDYPKSSHYLLNAYELGHENPSSLALAAIAFEKQQLWSHAEKLYLEIIDLFPDHFAGYCGISYLFATGQAREIGPQRGIDYALRAVEINPCMASWEVLSAVYARCQMFEKAHQIQSNLLQVAESESMIAKRQEILKRIEQRKILPNHLIPRIEVA